MLPKDYYNLVEQPGYLKNILYSDSVIGECKTTIRLKDNLNRQYSFNKIWDYLKSIGKIIEIIGNKEYIFFEDDELKTLSYDINLNTNVFSPVKYIMRHYIKDYIIKLKFRSERSLSITKNHSLIDIVDNQLIPKKYTETNHCFHLYNFDIFYDEIQKKTQYFYKGYVYDFEVPETHNFTANGFLVHNTDSIFVLIPGDTTNVPLEKKWEIAVENAKGINDIITKYLNEYLLPKCNINPKYNYIYFKTELVMQSGLFLDVKKCYAYLMLIKEGKIIDPPKIKYTGIQVVKSDAIKMTQDFLKELIEDIALKPQFNIEEKKKKITECADKYYLKFKECISLYDFKYIGVPGKWSKKDLIIYGMELYNYIMGKEIFTFGSAGKFVYCIFKDHKLLKDHIDLKNTKGICVPYEYDIEEFKSKMIQFRIIADINEQWNRINSGPCQRVIHIIRNSG